MRALLATAVLLLSTSLAAAQPNPATVLTGVDQAYAKVKAAKLDFMQTTNDAVFGTSAKSNGHIYMSRPKLRWTYLPAKGGKPTKEFVVGGGKLVYLNHLNKEYTSTGVKASAVPAALSWLTGKGRLSKEFSPVITATTKSTIELELTPLKPSAAYSKIKLVVDAKTYQVQESVVTASNGNTSGYVFTNVNLAPKFGPTTFEVRLNSKALQNYREVNLAPASQGASSGASPGASPPADQ